MAKTTKRYSKNKRSSQKQTRFQKSTYKFRKASPLQKLAMIVFVILFAVVGVIVLRASFAQPVFSPPASIAADCSVDVTNPATINNANTNLQAWFNSVPDDSIVSLPANACYNTEYPFNINARSSITIDGHNSTFLQKTNGAALTYGGKDSARGRGSIKIQDSSNVVVNDLEVKGTRTGPYTGCYNQALEAQHGFNIAGSSGTKLNNVTVKDVWGDFLEFSSGRNGVLSTNSTVTNSTFSGAGRQGIGLTWANGVTISGSTFDTVCRSAIDIEPLAASSGEVHNVTIDANTWKDFNYAWFSAGGTSLDVTNITVKNNTTDRMNVSASAPGPGRSGFYFTGNKVSSPARNESSFGFDTVNDVLVQDNTYASSAADPEAGVKLTNVNKARVIGNTVTESTPGVKLRGTVTDVIVQDNTYNISVNNKGYRAVLAYCTENGDGTCTIVPFTNTLTIYECNDVFPGIMLRACPATSSGGGTTTDTSAPTVKVLNPISNATVSGNVLISATATDNIGVSQMRLYVDGARKQVVKNSSEISWSWDTSSYASGPHVVKILAQDAANNRTISDVTVYK